MRLSIPSSLLISTLLFFLLQTPTFAVKMSYIVYLGAHSHGPEPTAIDLNRVTNSHYELLGSYLGSNEKAQEQIFYSYTRNINGFAAILEEEEAGEIAKNPNVVSVFLNKGKKLHTTRSWDFLGVVKAGVVLPDSIWRKARFGEDTIIGNIDTGVWPESKSFNDEGMGPVPLKWRGICQNDAKDGFRCNRKLIGARYFNKGYAAHAGHINSNFQTVRDYTGHGTHTLSTAGGSFVPGANVFGNGNGTAKGGSPKARVAAYKVCWDEDSCSEADILAAFDAAISDGIDVLSVSLGADEQYEFFNDGISIGAFHAVNKGIVVVTAAGNSGPSRCVSNVSPWMITVGASTMDREFTNYVVLGNKKHLKGTSFSSGALPFEKFYPLISAATAKAANAKVEEALLCLAGTLDPKKVKGKIVVCLRGAMTIDIAGAVGMILVNTEEMGNSILVDPDFLFLSRISFTDGKTVSAYINSTKTPMAYITPVKTILGTKPAPVVATLSCRGPNRIAPTILKPDIVAPGVNVIAAYSEAASLTGDINDKRRTPFNILSGTSMACPHIAGIVGLLKTFHPDWSPAAIHSAVMTTATTRSNDMKPIISPLNSSSRADPLDFGAGHVRPNRAMDPGLVYDLTVNDYLNFLCGHGYNQSVIKLFSKKPYLCPKSMSLVDYNYPAIVVPDLGNGTTIVTRTVKNVGSPGTYKARVKVPVGISVSVSPSSLKFERTGEQKTFKVIFNVERIYHQYNNFLFGKLIWSDSKHYVRSPIVMTNVFM